MKQHITRLVDDEGAVSPVIGVILMVAITVILAAVIGTFVLGLGGQVSQTAPQASLTVQEVNASGDSISFKHGGSDPIAFADTNIKVSINGSSVVTFDEPSSDGDGADFTTADTLEVDLNTNTGDPDGVYLNGNTNNMYTAGDPTEDIVAGASDYTVTFVDQPSGQVIAEKTGTA